MESDIGRLLEQNYDLDAIGGYTQSIPQCSICEAGQLVRNSCHRYFIKSALFIFFSYILA